jgi:hypothetical protein
VTAYAKHVFAVPSRVLPDNLNEGAFRDGRTVYIDTRHLSYFALLKPKAATKKLSVSIAAAGAITHGVLTIRASATVAANGQITKKTISVRRK